MLKIKSSLLKICSFCSVTFLAGLAYAQAKTPTVPNPFAEEITLAKKMIDMLVEFCVKYSFQVLGGIIVIILGWMAANFITKFLEKFLEKKNVDVTVAKFMISIVKIMVVAFAALIALGKFGITIAPFIAGLSVIGFGATFALQGPLSNYAAGITLIFTKPFKVGDIVEVASVQGEVIDITLARTELKTVDSTTIYVPNKHIIGEVIHNYITFKKINLNVGVSYGSDMNKVLKIVKDIMAQDERVTQNPEPKVGISEFADSSVNIYARVWCKPSVYWDVLFDLNKKVFDKFNEEGISIPFPQRDVTLYEKK